jgi:hypothetical protein
MSNVGQPRQIKIEFERVTDEQYADLAHAAWMLLMAAGLADKAQVVADTADANDELIQRWDHYGKNYPWS